MRAARTTTGARVGTLATLCVAAALALPAAAGAATFDVDPGAADAVDASPGDGVCDDGSGACPLRAAVIESNALSGPDVIEVPAGTVELAIPVSADDEADGDLDLTDPVEIRGAGREETVIEQTVQPPAASDRVLDIALPSFSDPGVVLGDLTVTGGYVDGAPAFDGGGGIRITNSGQVAIELERVRVSDNVAEGTDQPQGGGIFMQAVSNPELEIADSVIDGNRVTNTDPAAPTTQSAVGGGIAAVNGAAAELEISGTRIAGNEVTAPSVDVTSHAGGGIRVNVATFSLSESVLEDNSAGRAGAVFINLPAGGATIASSTLAANEATDGSGGAIVAFGTGTLAVEGSTFAGHLSPGSGRVARMNPGSTLALDGVTSSSDGSDGASALSGSAATLSFRRTILDHAGADTCSGGTATFTSLGDNVFRQADADCNANAGIGDQVGVDPLLGPLAMNGGPIPTMALAPPSPALDAIGEDPCPPPATDQRGVPRPGRGGGSACDVGAFERAALDLLIGARRPFPPIRLLKARVKCLGTPCRVKVRARVTLRGEGEPMLLRARPNARRVDLEPGEGRLLSFSLRRPDVRVLRRHIRFSPQARRRTRAIIVARGAFGPQEPKTIVRRRFRRP